MSVIEENVVTIRVRKTYELVHNLVKPWSPKARSDAAKQVRIDHKRTFGLRLFGETSYLTDEERAAITRRIRMRDRL